MKKEKNYSTSGTQHHQECSDRGGYNDTQIPSEQEENSLTNGSETTSTISARIEIHEKKFVPLPKWNNDSTGEDVFEWWIR